MSRSGAGAAGTRTAQIVARPLSVSSPSDVVDLTVNDPSERPDSLVDSPLTEPTNSVARNRAGS
eukprot:2756478-Alexandrium_andersonii.AAC.1